MGRPSASPQPSRPIRPRTPSPEHRHPVPDPERSDLAPSVEPLAEGPVALECRRHRPTGVADRQAPALSGMRGRAVRAPCANPPSIRRDQRSVRVAPQGAGRGHRTSSRFLGSAEGETATHRTRDQAGDRSAELLVHAPIRAQGAGRPALHPRRRESDPLRRGGDLPLGDRPPGAPQAVVESRLTSDHGARRYNAVALTRQCNCITLVPIAAGEPPCLPPSKPNRR